MSGQLLFVLNSDMLLSFLDSAKQSSLKEDFDLEKTQQYSLKEGFLLRNTQVVFDRLQNENNIVN